jgi:hypothetical protein
MGVHKLMAPRAGWGGPQGRTPSTATHTARAARERSDLAGV